MKLNNATAQASAPVHMAAACGIDAASFVMFKGLDARSRGSNAIRAAPIRSGIDRKTDVT